MRFAATEEQLEFAATVRAVLERNCRPEDVRHAWGGATGVHVGCPGGDGRVPAAWEALVELGATALMVPEPNGGLGFSDDHLVALVKECGYAALPEPFAATAGVAAGLLAALVPPADGTAAAGARSGSQAASTWLAAIAAGARVGVGFGAEPIVAGAATMDALVLVDGDRVTLAEAGQLDLEPLESVDGARRLCRLRCPRSAEPLAEGPLGSQLATVALDRAATLTAAELIGLSRRMLRMTVDYATERRQFGVPIGSFQAVKHHLADAALGVEFAVPLVMTAGHHLALGRPASVPASMAALRASEAAERVGRAALQCHGAIGYTVEHDLHLYLKRSWALRRQHHDEAWHRARVREALLGV